MVIFSKHRFVSGIILGTAIMAGLNRINAFVAEVNHLPPPSTANQTLEFAPVQVDPSWVKAGSPNFRATMFASSPDGKRNSGIWVCDGPSTFEWSFALDETVYILEGEVKITYQDKDFTLKPGDSAVFHAGTKAVWHVPKHLKKSFTLHEPEKLIKMYRKIIS